MGPEILKSALDKVPSKVKETAFVRLWALKNVPLLAWVNPTVEEMDESKVVVKIPLNFRTRNHLKSMYFGTLCCGADAAGGLLAFKLARYASEKVDIVFKDFEASFLKRAESDTYFICEDGEAISQLMDEAISSGERVNLPVKVLARCPEVSGDELVAEFTLTLSVKKKKA